MMRTYINLLLVLLLYSSFSFAQTNPEVLNVDYLVMSKDNTDSKELEPSAMMLSIGKEFSKFYWVPLQEYRKYNMDISGHDVYTVYKGFPDKTQLTFCGEVVKIPYTYSEPLPDFGWEIQDGDTIVCGYNCQKATATFRGVTWTAWFSIDLPYSDGPWKLCGLPGLILRAYDSKCNYFFTAVEVKKGDGKEIKTDLKYSKKSSPEGYAKEMIAYGKAPDQYRTDHGRGRKIIVCDENGNKVEFHTTPWVPNLFEYFDVNE